MELPWTKNRRLNEQIDSLETDLLNIEEKLEKTQKKLEAEKKRRSELSHKKQDAEKKINKLRDKVQSLEDRNSRTKSEKTSDFESITPNALKNSLKKLGMIEGKNLVTVYSPKKLRDHSNVTEIKNSVPKNLFEQLSGKEGILLFYDEDLGAYCFRARPFFSEMFSVSTSFKTGGILKFFDKKKTWVQVSRGDSRVVMEEDGELQELEKIRDRVDRKHGKGGFSQGRFERKRKEQIEQHLKKVENQVKKLEYYYVLGDREICKRFDGEYLGGFDPLKSPRENFYQVQRLKSSGN